MKVSYHKKFSKHFERLSFKLQGKVIDTVELFRKNPFDPILKNHVLRGEIGNRRTISVTGDVRIIFEEYNNYVLGSL